MKKITYINYFTSSALAIALSLSAYSVPAATTTENSDDASAIGTSATPQIKQQNKTTDMPTSTKNTSKKSRMHKSDEDMKMMARFLKMNTWLIMNKNSTA